jgi:hypothetical protein
MPEMILHDRGLQNFFSVLPKEQKNKLERSSLAIPSSLVYIWKPNWVEHILFQFGKGFISRLKKA